MIKKDIRITAIIPTYNNSRTIASVINEVKKYLTDIIVINDGSTDTTGEILKKVQNISTITIGKNRGKGNALRQGLQKALSEGFTHAITIDADGQHLAQDIPVFIEQMRQEPDTLWIGNRILSASDVPQPRRSRFGAKFGAFWYRFYTDIAIADTQCGFRAYPIKPVLDLGCKAQRYGWELEVLIQSAWNHIAVKEIPIHLFYHPKGERVSHFQPVRDFVRLSKINSRAAMTRIFLPWKFIDAPGATTKEKIKLLFIQELTVYKAPKHAAVSLSLGTFVGLLPIQGFQTITILLLCVRFKLNMVLAFLGVNISALPFLPFWIATGYFFGRIVLPSAVVKTGGHMLYTIGLKPVIFWLAKSKFASILAVGFIQWVIGSVVMACTIAFLTFVITYLVLLRYNKTKNRGAG